MPTVHQRLHLLIGMKRLQKLIDCPPGTRPAQAACNFGAGSQHKTSLRCARMGKLEIRVAAFLLAEHQ